MICILASNANLEVVEAAVRGQVGVALLGWRCGAAATSLTSGLTEETDLEWGTFINLLVNS